MKRFVWILVLTLLVVSNSTLAKYRIRQTRNPSKLDFQKAVLLSRNTGKQFYRLFKGNVLRANTKPQARTTVDRKGNIYVEAKIKVNVNFETFLKRMDLSDWSLNLPQRWGGEVIRVKDTRNQTGTGRGEVFQRERMALGFPGLDMTKNTKVTISKDSASVEWHVTDSDRSFATLWKKNTVKMDNGSITVLRTSDNQVEIISRSAHNVSTIPSLPLEILAPKIARTLTAATLRSYFRNTVKRFKDIGEGRRKVAVVHAASP